MGELRDKLFYQFVNKTLDQLRGEFREKYTPKKGNRFLIKGITYEISPCSVVADDFVFEISSKIPQELLPPSTKIEKYFDAVVKLVKKAEKKPAEAKMENIVHNANDVELKERDYVKLTYSYRESELYTLKDLEKKIKQFQSRSITIPDIPGIATPKGKLVLIMVGEGMMKSVRRNMQDLIDANEEVKKKMKGSAAKPAAKAAPKPKSKAKPVAKKKPAAKAKTAKKKAVEKKK